MSIIRARDISLSVGPEPLFDKIGFVIQPGERIALVGRNGAGKSTLFNLLAGNIKADSGILEKNEATKVAMLVQEVPHNINARIVDLVTQGLGESGRLIAEYEALTEQYATTATDECLNKLMACQHQIDQISAWDAQQKVHEVLSKLELDGHLAFADLSGGMKRRVLLAKALVSEPDLLLLDEPTNHLDIESIIWLESFLQKYQAALLFVSHDRAFLRNLAQRVLELDRGKLSDWQGGFDNYLQRKEEALHAEALEQARFDKKLSQEEEWIRQGIKARRTRNEGRVRALKAMRQEKAAQRKQQGQVKASAQLAEKSGKKVITAKNIDFAFAEHNIIKNFSLNVMRGDKIGIIGANGCGKSTLVKVLLKDLQPQIGTVEHGTDLSIKYFDQHRAILDENLSVRDNVAGGSDKVTINGQDKHIISYLSDFLFTPDRANQSISKLSGGERNRLLLAKLFATPANVLVLDEPTNDLDADTLDLLEEILADYQGTVILISHDRDFINHIVTSTIVFEGQGKWQEYVGGYDDWLAQRPKVETSNAVANKKDNRNTTAATKKKLSYKEEKELAALPEKMAQLEHDISELQQQLAQPEVFQDQSKVVALSQKLGELEQQLENAFERWEELENISTRST